MLLEVGDVLEDTGVEASVERYKGLCLNSDNVYRQFTENVSGVLDTGPHSELTWKKVVIFFSSAAGFGINLHTNNMGHLATQLPVWMAQIMQSKLQPWIDDQGGWVSIFSVLLYMTICAFYTVCLQVCVWYLAYGMPYSGFYSETFILAKGLFH